MPSFTTTMTRREIGEEVEIEVEVEYTYHRGYPQTYEDPPEPEYCELESVHDLTTPLRDIGFGDADQERLEKLALEQIKALLAGITETSTDAPTLKKAGE